MKLPLVNCLFPLLSPFFSEHASSPLSLYFAHSDIDDDVLDPTVPQTRDFMFFSDFTTPLSPLPCLASLRASRLLKKSVGQVASCSELSSARRFLFPISKFFF